MPRFTSPGDKPRLDVIRLPKPLQDYIDYKTAPGNRNIALLAAAVQARDCRWTQGQSEARLIPLAVDRDGLKEVEALRTINSAYTREPRDAPRGGVAGYSSPTSARTVKITTKKDSPVIIYDLEPDFKIPDPIVSPAIALLEALYQPHERVYFIGAKLDEGVDTKERPDGESVIVYDRDILLKILREKTGGSLAKIFDTEKGLYFNLNPLRKHSERRRKEDMVEFRYALLEFDSIPMEEQFQVLIKSKIPLAAILDSGHHSVHGIVKINAGNDEALFKARKAMINEHFRAYKPDPNTDDVTRLSRFPGVHRLDFEKGEQKLLKLGVGCEDWDAWEREVMVEQDGLPSIKDMFNLLADVESGKLIEPEEVIVGVAHKGCKLGVSAASKARKTWVLADLAASVVTGSKWFDRLKCNKGKVLYLNMELPEFFMANRVRMILEKKGLTLEKGMFHVINLRGFAAHLQELRPKIEHAIESMEGLTLILLDPTYKLMPGGDESGTSDTSLLLNEMERLAVKSGALVAFASHFSKGNQAFKSAIDRSSGSGVFARDPDSIIVMTEHKAADALTVDMILRNHTPVDSFVIKWDMPIFTVDKELDPAELAEPKIVKKAPADEGFVLTPGKRKILKEWLDANPENSQRKLIGFLMTHRSKLWKAGRERVIYALIPWLEENCIESFEGEKEGKKPTLHYRYVETVKKPEPKVDEKIDETEPF